VTVFKWDNLDDVVYLCCQHADRSALRGAYRAYCAHAC